MGKSTSCISPTPPGTRARPRAVDPMVWFAARTCCPSRDGAVVKGGASGLELGAALAQPITRQREGERYHAHETWKAMPLHGPLAWSAVAVKPASARARPGSLRINPEEVGRLHRWCRGGGAVGLQGPRPAAFPFAPARVWLTGRLAGEWALPTGRTAICLAEIREGC